MRNLNKGKYLIVLFITSTVLIANSLAFADILIPNDPLFDSWDENNPQGNNWGQEFIKLPSAWDIETGNKDIKVAVVDTGFDILHEDLEENISVVGPINMVRAHGTRVAGIVGAKGNNVRGIAGTMWDSSLHLYSVALGEYLDPIASILAMKVSILKGVKVVNYSAGRTFKTLEKAEEQRDAWKNLLFSWIEEKNKDVLFVFAAGKYRKDFIYTSPANLSREQENVISVAANNQNGELARWLIFNGSDYGEVSVAAPGVDIYSTLPLNSYAEDTGTSFAAPFVSGLAGLIWSKAEELGEELTAAEVRDLIIQGAVNGNKFVAGPDNKQIPIINAYESLKLLVGPPGPGLADTPWPMFQHDLRHTGQSEYLGPQTANLKWTFDTGFSISSSPIVGFDGTIYIGSGNGKFYALNPDGSQKWVYDTGTNVYRSTSVLSQDGTIYFGAGHSLYALTSQGQLKWKYPVGGPVGSSPTIGQGGTIYFGSEDGWVYAVNPDGTLKWRFFYKPDDIYSSPAIAIGLDGTIYIGSELRNNLYALNPDGSLKWFYHANGYFNSSPSIAEDGTIYIGSGPGINFALHAINPDGSQKWIHPVDSWIYWSSPAVNSTDGTIFIGSYTIPSFNPQEGKVYAVGPDGSRRWTYTTGGKVDSSPAIGSDGTIYIGSDDGKIQALNPSDGTLKWEYTTAGPVTNSSAIDAQGNLYIGSYDGKLYCFGE